MARGSGRLLDPDSYVWNSSVGYDTRFQAELQGPVPPKRRAARGMRAPRRLFRGGPCGGPCRMSL